MKSRSFCASGLGLWVGVAGMSALANAAEVTAQIDWAQRVELANSVSGVVREVLVEPGQNVAAGALLVQLDARPYAAALAEARADIERFTQEAADAQRDLDRVQELYVRTVSSTTELDAAKVRHARAQAMLAAAQARSEKARYQLDETELRAPFPARILERRVEPGFAAPAQCQPATLLVIARADEFRATLEVDAAHAAALRPGAEAKLLSQGKTVPVTLRAVVAKADGRFGAEWRVPATASLWPGQKVTLELP